MVATALDLSQIKTDALSSAATFRSLIGLGSSDRPTFLSLTLSQTIGNHITFSSGASAGFIGVSASSGFYLLAPTTRKIRFLTDIGIVEQSYSNVAQEYRLYNTYTDASNYERGFLKWDANTFKIGTEAAGTGVTRSFELASPTTITGGTVTASTPVLDATQTWNDAAVTFTGMKLDVTNTASASDSMLMDLQVGGSSVLKVQTNVRNYPGVVFPGGGYIALSALGYTVIGASNQWNGQIGAQTIFAVRGGGITLSGTTTNSLSWGSITGVNRLSLHYDADNTLAQRNGTNAQEFRLYNTYTDASNYERAFLKWDANVFKIGTEAAGTGTVRTLTIENVAKINGSTSSAADPSTTEYPNDGDHGIHKNTTSGNVFLAYNDGGSSIVKVQLS